MFLESKLSSKLVAKSVIQFPQWNLEDRQYGNVKWQPLIND